jgi:hypothetical protein
MGDTRESDRLCDTTGFPEKIVFSKSGVFEAICLPFLPLFFQKQLEGVLVLPKR